MKPLSCSSSRAVGTICSIAGQGLKTSTSLMHLCGTGIGQEGKEGPEAVKSNTKFLQTCKSVYLHIMDSNRLKEVMESSLTPNFTCPFIQPPNPQAEDFELGHISNPAGSAEQCFTGAAHCSATQQRVLPVWRARKKSSNSTKTWYSHCLQALQSRSAGTLILP